MKFEKLFDNTLSILSVGWSIENINNILGIILLVLSIFRILWSTGYKVYLNIKRKKYEDVEKSINEGIDEINSLVNKEGNND